MQTQFAHNLLCLHETTHLKSGTVIRFVQGFTEHYQPLMERHGARLFGIWQGDPFNSNWTEVSTIWEIDGWKHYSSLGAARHRDSASRDAFRQWEGLLGEIGATGEGRITYPNRRFKPVDQLKAEGFQSTVCIQEVMRTKPDRQDAYIEQLEYQYVPWSERTGKLWLGSFTTYLRNNEVIHYWAMDGGWDGFAKYYPAWGEVIPPDIKSWMALAPALRDSWDDSILQSLSPNPLG